MRQDIPDVKISKPLLTSLTITNSVSLIYLSLKVPISSEDDTISVQNNSLYFTLTFWPVFYFLKMVCYMC